ncbi:hypothetical protein LSH36_22g10081, partial [Paralvinella palmiformis]
VYILLILAHLKSIQEIQVNHVAAINCHGFPIHPASSSRTIRSIRTASYRLSGNRRTESRSSSRSGPAHGAVGFRIDVVQHRRHYGNF